MRIRLLSSSCTAGILFLCGSSFWYGRYKKLIQKKHLDDESSSSSSSSYDDEIRIVPFPYETFQDWKRISQKRKDDFAIRSSNPSSSTNNDAHEEEDTTTMDTSSSLWKLIHLPLLAHPNPNHVVVITMDDDDDNSDYEKNEKNHFNNGTTSTTNVYMRHVWQHRSVVTDLTIVKLIITHSDHDHRSSRIQHQLKQQEQDEIRIRYITIFNWNDLVSMGLWNNHNNHNGPDDSNSSAQRNHHNHTTWNDKNNNKNEDGLSPVNLVLLDQGATGHFLDTATTTDDHLRRQILRVFQSKPNEEEEEDEKDDDDDDDMEDSREPNADTKQPPQNHLTVITEFPGPADHGLSAHRRFQLANLLDRDDDDDVDDDEDWDMMTDYTILVRPRKSHGRPLLNTYVVLWEDSVSQAYWQYNEAEWNRHLHARFAATAMSLDAEEDWIDSTLHLPTEYPSRHSEIVFCQGPLAKETGVDCDIGGGTGIPPDQTNIPTRLLQIQPSSQGDYAGRGLFTTVDIPPHSMVGGEQPMIYLDWPSTELLRSFWRHHETNDIYDDELVDILYSYFDGYGFVRVAKGKPFYVVDSTRVTFVNHGCNGTANVGVVSQYHEGNLNIPHSLLQKVSGTMTRDSNGGTQSSTIHVYDALRALIPEEYLDDESEDDFYLPIRKPASAIHTETTDQWIYAGSEILDNYLNFGGMLAPDFWENVEMLQRECSGLPGDVQRWEQDEDEDDETNDPTKCENGGCHNEL